MRKLLRLPGGVGLNVNNICWIRVNMELPESQQNVYVTSGMGMFMRVYGPGASIFVEALDNEQANQDLSDRTDITVITGSAAKDWQPGQEA